MLLVLFTVSTLFLGSSADHYKVCYGESFSLPSDITPPLYQGPVILMPSRGGPMRTVMDNGTAIEPRLKISFTSATLTDLRERDEGTYFVGQHSFFMLKILDCAKEVETYYGEIWRLSLPEKAEILEITPLNRVNPVVLWNRTNPQVKSVRRGWVNQNFWQVENITQSENGFYNIRQKDNTLLSRTHLNVKEHVRHYTKRVDEYLIIEYPWDNGTWFVNFRPKETTGDIILIKDGLKHSEKWFDWRLEIQSAGIKIVALEITDSGTFRFRDKKFDLVLVAHLEMKDKHDDDPPPPPLLLVYISVAFLLGGLLCCWFTRDKKCWKKCWKKCCRRDKSAPQAAAPPAAHYHSESQSVVPGYSAIPPSVAQPENPLQKPTADPHV
ncbi:uncharacterized protein LOC111571996 [Amphiprion ocellaris]|uniref:uncharacterized protein LOC111571996 n=1 Tax=Amphiprion ocellaris TaxID=80972 RepID=UPI002410DD4B|nr:uncharacterized protein LOC111571996 [Amphiprion ocellaris]XP_023131222.2 uncharacterized protein LOC111571996 [Amphiprion ocellaris]